jgi:uncharacterized protein (DUF2141 family)
MAENLRTTLYRDGSAIPTGLSDASWSSTTSGAMAVYNNEKFFLSETQVFCGAITPLAPETSPTLSCDKLPFGQYAVAVYHDLNNNNKMDKNALGIPTEPYAFSNNVGVKWRSPKFADAVFVLSNAKQELTISLKRWSEY